MKKLDLTELSDIDTWTIEQLKQTVIRLSSLTNAIIDILNETIDAITYLAEGGE